MWMSTSSSSLFNVGFAMAVEVNARVALSAT